MVIGIWLQARAGGRPGAPGDWPLGRAVLYAERRGVSAILGVPDGPGTFAGARVVQDRWVPVERQPVQAVYDRFPSVGRAAAAAAGRRWIGEVPLANPPELISLCQDKLATQRALESAGVQMPAVTGALPTFTEALGAWGVAYLKPRGGSFGEGVRRVVVGEPLPREGEWVLQAAVPPPQGLAGLCLRVLVQALPGGRWIARPPVVRRSITDPVVNAARGAELLPGDDQPYGDSATELAVQCARVLDRAAGGGGVELGVDLVVDKDGQTWPIEVNGRPRGRLLALADRWPDRYRSAHIEACAQPLLTLAHRARPAPRGPRA